MPWALRLVPSDCICQFLFVLGNGLVHFGKCSCIILLDVLERLDEL